MGGGDAASDGDGMNDGGVHAQEGGGLSAKRDKQQIVAKREKQEIVALAAGGGGGGAGGSAWAPIGSNSTRPHTSVGGGDEDNSSDSSSRPPAPVAVTETSAAGSEQSGCAPGTAVRQMGKALACELRGVLAPVARCVAVRDERSGRRGAHCSRGRRSEQRHPSPAPCAKLRLALCCVRARQPPVRRSLAVTWRRQAQAECPAAAPLPCRTAQA